MTAVREALLVPAAALALMALSAWAAGGAGEAPAVIEDPSWTERMPTLAAGPRRVVSGTLATDEILLDLLPPSRIAALTIFADDVRVSNAVEASRQVGPRVDTDPERMLALDPDLVFVARYTQRESVTLIETSGVPVVRMPFCATLEEVRRGILHVGRAVGEEAKAAALVAGMDAGLGAVAARVAGARPPRVLFLNPGGYVAGRGTLYDELLTVAGGVNVPAEAGVEGPGFLPLERLLALDPDIILVSDYIGDPKARELRPARDLREDPAWGSARAVLAGRVHTVSERHLTCVSHHLAGAAEALARVLHPERFP